MLRRQYPSLTLSGECIRDKLQILARSWYLFGKWSLNPWDTHQSTFGLAMMRRVKHLFLLSVPWYLRASALSLAWSSPLATTWLKTVILAISVAFLEPESFIGEGEAPGTGESRGDTPPASLVLLKVEKKNFNSICFIVIFQPSLDHAQYLPCLLYCNILTLSLPRPSFTYLLYLNILTLSLTYP